MNLGDLNTSTVRVWAELGRVRVPIGTASNLPSGAILELANRTDDPVTVFANGIPIGRGKLMTTADGAWAVELISVDDDRQAQAEDVLFDLWGKSA
jgi:flagellar motor switch protein FliN/FliY